MFGRFQCSNSSSLLSDREVPSKTMEHRRNRYEANCTGKSLTCHVRALPQIFLRNQTKDVSGSQQHHWLAHVSACFESYSERCKNTPEE